MIYKKTVFAVLNVEVITYKKTITFFKGDFVELLESGRIDFK